MFKLFAFSLQILPVLIWRLCLIGLFVQIKDYNYLNFVVCKSQNYSLKVERLKYLIGRFVSFHVMKSQSFS
jgi:hypothetical protein